MTSVVTTRGGRVTSVVINAVINGVTNAGTERVTSAVTDACDRDGGELKRLTGGTVHCCHERLW
ncbi:MAG: hypothetical protein M3545_12105 [Acidobacteriota bacterium]|nr:hypothetical protein [Acidobacteriota bacterium]